MLFLLFKALDNAYAPPPQASKIAWLSAWQYAHRGLHDSHAEGKIPENSLAAFEAARDGGFGIECDVQHTSDGFAAVFHDFELDKLTARTGKIAQCTLSDLIRIPLVQSDQLIPSLAQALECVGGKVPLLIEIKTDTSTHVRALCMAVRRALEGYLGPHAIMGFDPRVSRWFARHSPHTPRGLIISEDGKKGLRATIARHRALWTGKPDFLAYDVRDFPSAFARKQRARGLPVLTWTVNSPDTREVATAYADAPIFEGAGHPPAQG